jgi:hypothetical protein
MAEDSILLYSINDLVASFVGWFLVWNEVREFYLVCCESTEPPFLLRFIIKSIFSLSSLFLSGDEETAALASEDLDLSLPKIWSLWM